jgi:hypothetical protein
MSDDIYIIASHCYTLNVDELTLFNLRIGERQYWVGLNQKISKGEDISEGN